MDDMVENMRGLGVVDVLTSRKGFHCKMAVQVVLNSNSL